MVFMDMLVFFHKLSSSKFEKCQSVKSPGDCPLSPLHPISGCLTSTTSWELVLVLSATTMKSPPKFLPHNLVLCWLKYTQFGIVLTKICTEVSYFWCQAILSTQEQIESLPHSNCSATPKLMCLTMQQRLSFSKDQLSAYLENLILYSYLQGFFLSWITY